MDFFGLVVLYLLFKFVLPAILKKKRVQVKKAPKPVFTIPPDDEEEELHDLPQPEAKAKIYVNSEPQDMGNEGTGINPLLVPKAPLTAVVTDEHQIFSKNDLRNGFIMSEILGKPKALTTPEEGRYPC